MSQTTNEVGEILHAALSQRLEDRGSGAGGAGSVETIWRGAGEPNAVTYGELILLAKRFRDDRAKGRVLYKGPLMHLLDVPNLSNSEALVVRDLTRLEEGGRSMEEVVSLLDRYNDHRIRSQDLHEGFEQLCPHSFGRLKGRDAQLIVARITRGEGAVSTDDLLAWMRRRQPSGDTEAKLRKLLAKAEHKLGIRVGDAFAKFDPRHSGFIPVDIFLTVIAQLQGSLGADHAGGLSEAQLVRYAKGRTLGTQKSGSVSLTRFMEQMGRSDSYTSARHFALLRDILTRVGASLEDQFAAWDADKGGSISVAELVAGLKKWGLERAMAAEDAHRIVSELDRDSKGELSLRDIFEFMGHDFDKHVQDRVRKTLLAAEADQAPLDEVFKEWNSSKTGTLTLSELHSGLRDTGTTLFSHIGTTEVQRLLDTIARSGTESSVDGSGVRLNDLILFVGIDPNKYMAAKLKRIILHAEQRGAISIEDLFREWDKDGSGDISPAELEEGLHQIGVFDQLKRDEVRPLLQSLDPDDSGGISIKEFMEFLGRKFTNYVEARLRKVIQIAGISLQEVFAVIDTDGSGSVSAVEFEAGLKKINGFEDVSPEDMKVLISRYDMTGSGEVSLAEFTNVFNQSSSAGNVEAKFKEVLTKAKEQGFSMRECFDDLDLDGDGKVTADELERGLKALGASIPSFKGITRDDVLALVRKFDMDGDLVIARSEFMRFGVQQGICSAEEAAVPPPQFEPFSPTFAARGTEDASDLSVDGRNGAGNGDNNELQVEPFDLVDTEAMVEYEFSHDPQTAAVERKLRRVAQTFQVRAERTGQSDIEYLFRQYDGRGMGSVLRSEFVNVLMQLGLSLLDVPGGSTDLAENSEQERRRRMGQLARLKGSVGSRTVRMRTRRPGMLGASEGGEAEDLALIKWYREGHKKTMMRNIIESGIKSEYHIFPRFGETIFFEHQLDNPFNSDERLVVQVDNVDPALKLVSDAREWAYLRANVRPPPGVGADLDARDGGKVEDDMFALGTASSAAELWVRARETVRVPFSYLSMAPPNHQSGNGNRLYGQHEDHSVVVKFASASHGIVVALVEVHVHPRPPIVHRTLRFHQGEGAIVKRCVRLASSFAGSSLSGVPFVPTDAAPGRGNARRLDKTNQHQSVIGVDVAPGFAHHVNGVKMKYISPVEDGEKNVVLESREAPDGTQEIYMKYAKLGTFPASGDFYVCVFDDQYRGRLHELWHVVVSSRLCKDVHAALGQATTTDLVVRGDRHMRRVRAYASNGPEVNFMPASVFQLASTVYNQLSLRWTPLGDPGTRKAHVHLVDVDSKQLVCAWLLTAVASPPQVTKEFDVDVALNAPAHKKVSYDNPWDRVQTYRLRSSNPNVMRPKTDRIQIEPHGRVYIRIYISPMEQRGVSEVYLMVNDESDQNDECFRILINADH